MYFVGFGDVSKDCSGTELEQWSALLQEWDTENPLNFPQAPVRARVEGRARGAAGRGVAARHRGDHADGRHRGDLQGPRHEGVAGREGHTQGHSQVRRRRKCSFWETCCADFCYCLKDLPGPRVFQGGRRGRTGVALPHFQGVLRLRLRGKTCDLP